MQNSRYLLPLLQLQLPLEEKAGRQALNKLPRYDFGRIVSVGASFQSLSELAIRPFRITYGKQYDRSGWIVHVE